MKHGVRKDREEPITDFNEEYFGLSAKSPSKLWYGLMIIWIIILWFLFGNDLLRGELNLTQALVSGAGVLIITYSACPFKH